MPRNWEEHYCEAGNLDFTPSPLLVEVAEMLRPGRALDLASGAGRNALYLAALGWEVVAVDGSPAAIRILRERAADGGLRVEARVADLEAGAFTIPSADYDLICDFLYLQRSLFPQIREGVRPGGVFAGEMLLRGSVPSARPHRPEFLLEPGELRNTFAGWKIVYYSEAEQQVRATAQIVARRA